MSTTVPPSAPSPTLPSHTAQGEEPTSTDGLDLRKCMSLSPLEQLERLEADGLALTAREKGMRAAEAELKTTKGDSHDNA